MRNNVSRGALRWGWIVGLLFAACLLLALLTLSPRLPVYQGKTLYQWASELQKAQENYSNPNRWRDIQAAQSAILAIGTNALPFVMADIQARPSIKDRAIRWLAHWIPSLKLRPEDVADRWVRGIRVLEVLGPLAKLRLAELIALATNSTGYSEGALLAVGPDALPAFTNLLSTSKFPRTGNLIGAFANAVYAARIKPEQAAMALPYLVQVFRSTDSHGRWYAAGAFGAVHQQAELCIPLLIEGLTDSAPNVRQACLESLGHFGDAASAHAGKLADAFEQADASTRVAICNSLAKFRSADTIAVPVLVRALLDTNESVRVWAATGLGQLASLPEQALPALCKGLEDSSRLVRLMAAQSLGQFRERASNAIPALNRASSDQDASVRDTVTNALRRIKS